MNTADLYELSFTDEELKKLAPEELAVMLLLGHISNEIGALQRLLGQCYDNRPTEVEIDEAYRVYLFFLIRSMWATLVEATKALNKSQGVLRKAKTARLSAFFDELIKDLKRYKQSAHFEVIKNVRNKTRYHYDLDVVVGLVKGRDTFQPFKGYLHDNSVNSFSPFAENFFSGELVIGELGKKENLVTPEQLIELIEWGLEFLKFFQEVFEKYILEIHTQYFPTNIIPEISRRYDARHCVQQGEGFAPLFYEPR
ncbi:MAG: hypothetical protein OIF40_15465 [Mangrovicoccus sp.]|nr:hypothetical protein [Mangrovicoccus sp.]